MAAEWTINNLDFYKSHGGKTDVVFNIHWNCADEDESGNKGRCYGTIVIPTDDLSSFTAYSDITEAIQVELDKISRYQDQIAVIKEYFYSSTDK